MKEYIVRMIEFEGGVMCAAVVTAHNEKEAIERFKNANPMYIADCSPMCERYEVVSF